MRKHIIIMMLILGLLLGVIPAFSQGYVDMNSLLFDEETPEAPVDDGPIIFTIDDDDDGPVFFTIDDDDETETAAAAPVIEREPLPDYSYDELVVGNPTQLEGNFYSDMWGDNTADLDVRQLLHGYNLVTWDGEEGMFTFDSSVVNGVAVYDNDEGDRTYYISLYTDLYYSDGTQISAADYAFTYLLQLAREIEQLGGKPLRLDHIMGAVDYAAGVSNILSGVRLTDEMQLAITIRHEYLPFFYELGLLYCTPTPVHVVVPGCEVRDDGNGVYISGPYSAELLRQTILDPQHGYLLHPSAVSGPYMLTSYDGVTAEFEINPYFKGDRYGYAPRIQRLIYTVADNETMIEQLHSGEFGLLNKVTLADAITAGMGVVSGGSYSVSNYPRNGLTFIAFSTEKDAVNSQSVRHAIAYCMDKDVLVSNYVGNYGLRVEGFYGLGQWMYQLVNGTLAFPIEEPENPTPAEQREYEEELERWEALSMYDIPVYDLDVAQAVRLLVLDGWTLNQDGRPYVRGTDDIRCKEINGELVPMQLTLAYPAGNRIAVSMETNFIPYLREAGIELTLVPLSMEEILDRFYRRTDREYDMIYLGSNFDIVFDPSTHFVPGEDGRPTWNYTEMADDELYKLAVAMRTTEPGDVLDYVEYWLQFQERFGEVLPMIPIYSNIYFDFYPGILHNYMVSSEVTWTQAIVRSYLDDIEEELPEEDVDEFEEDGDFFYFDD